jgi:galactoside O-acetyltransferase
MHMNKIFRKLNSLFIITTKKIRHIKASLILGQIGNDSKILGRVVFYSPENISIGNFTSLNEAVIINGLGGVEIGDNVHISPGVIINSGGLNIANTGFDRKNVDAKVVISDGVWIASGAIVNPSVTIGKNSVVGAGSVVTKSIPENEVWVGVPAKFLKSINS